MSSSKQCGPHAQRSTQVRARIGIGRATVYAWMDGASPYHDPKFLKPICPGRNIGFIEWEVNQYMAEFMVKRAKP